MNLSSLSVTAFPKKPRLVVMLSGYGSNFQALLSYPTLTQSAEFIGVITDNPDAYGLTRAIHHQIPTEVVEVSNEYCTRESFGERLLTALQNYKPDWIILAGFMRILPTEVVAHYERKIINIHPSLLPEFRGLNTYKRALKARKKEHGTTVHLVIAELDAGPILAQAKLKIFSNDTVESLQQRTQKLEHILYPWVIEKLCQGDITFKDNQIYVEGALLTKRLIFEEDQLLQHFPKIMI